ncbi:MAG: type II toxin-antitoxin system HicB family antitoxin [Spirochaetota bacterium]|nr:type II toxin-antitoxin system HicB family antitoxin [Spirochaetota bacterium]
MIKSLDKASQNLKYIIYKEDEYYVSLCLNVEVSSFGDTKEEAIANLKEALELYFEDSNEKDLIEVSEVSVGEIALSV